MKASRKILILGGLALAVWWMGYGLYYAVFAEHQMLDRLGGSLSTSFVRAAEGKMAESQVALAAYAEGNYIYVRQVDSHGHWIGLGMLLIVLGIAFDRVSFDERVRRGLALGLLAGAAIFPLGVLLETFSHGAGPKVVAVVGSALVILALVGIALGFARAPQRT
jgi:hypothetical protein